VGPADVQRVKDWELWYALMEDERKTWPVYQLNVPADALGKIVAAAQAMGVSTVEFVEIAIRERLETEWGLYSGTVVNELGPQPCFFCGDMTMLADLTFEAPFCDSGICNWAINEDLRMATT
jgi:hypothetical protein